MRLGSVEFFYGGGQTNRQERSCKTEDTSFSSFMNDTERVLSGIADAEEDWIECNLRSAREMIRNSRRIMKWRPAVRHAHTTKKRMILKDLPSGIQFQ